MVAKKRRTREERAEATEHICYEVQMLCHSAQVLEKKPYYRGLVDQNAFLESFATHTRNPIDFLYSEKGGVKNDFVLAIDYVTNWDTLRPQLSARMKRARIQAHKQISHLTYARRKKHGWNYVYIVGQIIGALQEFFRHADKQLFKEHYHKIEAVIESVAETSNLKE